jgi:hypothetical protein
MADVEVAALEAKIRKLGAQWALDVTKILDQEKSAVVSRTNLLCNKLISLQVPEADPAELSNIPKRIKQILDEAGAAFKDMVRAELALYIDAKTRKLSRGAVGCRFY